jgi:hypothetical protein
MEINATMSPEQPAISSLPVYEDHSQVASSRIISNRGNLESRTSWCTTWTQMLRGRVSSQTPARPPAVLVSVRVEPSPTGNELLMLWL